MNEDAVRLLVEFLALVVFIFLGVRSGGVGLGLWGGVGVLWFAFVFQEPPGDPPTSAMFIIIAVISAAAAMQAAGGTDFLVRIASRIIRSNPKQITIIAPLVSYVFTVGAGTSNIYFSLIPVIEETAYANGIRPERPLAASTVAGGLGITSSPVSAAMAVMVGLMEPLGFSLAEMLAIVIPASVVAIVAGSFLQQRIGKELKDDPEYQRRLASGEIKAVSAADAIEDKPLPPRAALSAYIFLAGVAVIVALGLFEQLRPVYEIGPDEFEQLDVTTSIQMVMLTVATIILMTCQINPGQILKAPIFLSGMTGMIALFGIAWMADTFVSANIDYITELLSDLVTAVPFLLAVAIFAMAALTTSQSATTKSIVPIGIALGLPAQLIIAMWPSLIGVYFLPANGTQLAAIAADRTGSTKIGNFVVNHSFQPNTIFMWLASVIVGILLALVIYGTSADAVEPPPVDTPTAEATAAPEPTTEPEETPVPEDTPEADATATTAAEEPTTQAEVPTEAAATPPAEATATAPWRRRSMKDGSKANLLLLSNSSVYGRGYLEHAQQAIGAFLAGHRTVHFAPFALADRAGYTSRAKAALEQFGVNVIGLHAVENPSAALEEAEVLFVGGGNSFRLLKALHDRNLIQVTRRRVAAGELSYMGSSAGTNMASPTLRTTNDMPIVQPPSFESFGLVPFQINPHYLDPDPASTHMGETREKRIEQFLEDNDVPVLGMREGAWLRRQGAKLTLEGATGARLFRRGMEQSEFAEGADLSFLLDVPATFDTAASNQQVAAHGSKA